MAEEDVYENILFPAAKLFWNGLAINDVEQCTDALGILAEHGLEIEAVEQTEGTSLRSHQLPRGTAPLLLQAYNEGTSVKLVEISESTCGHLVRSTPTRYGSGRFCYDTHCAKLSHIKGDRVQSGKLAIGLPETNASCNVALCEPILDPRDLPFPSELRRSAVGLLLTLEAVPKAWKLVIDLMPNWKESLRGGGQVELEEGLSRAERTRDGSVVSNNNTFTNTANAEFSLGEDNNDGGDIEQGRIIISENSGSCSSPSSWAAAAITGGISTPTTSTATTTAWTQGGIENVDVVNSVPIAEAYLMEEEEGIGDTPHQAEVATIPVVVAISGSNDTVYEATPLEPELPWWKQRRNKALLVIFCVLITVLAVGLGVPRSPPPSPVHQGPFCSSCKVRFTTRDELKAAVDKYVQGDWGTADSSKYGWPIGSWLVNNVTDMSLILGS